MHASDRSGTGCAVRSLNVIVRPIGTLKLNPANPRAHHPQQIRQLGRSIQTFGFNVPILIDGNLNVITGHGRILAAQHLGLKEVPTICLDHLSAAQARAFIIADNRLAEISSWNDSLLAEQLRELSELDLDFSLEITGFEMGEIDLRIESLASAESDDDALTERTPINGPPVSRPGNLWKLGAHRIFCGNALDSEAYSRLMTEERAAMVFIDPPYNVPIDGHVSGLGATRHREFAMASGEMNEQQFSNFLAQSFALLARNSVNGSIHFCCMDWRHSGEILRAGNSVYTELKNVCVWVKSNAGMGSLYRSGHEFVFVFKSGRGAHQNNVELGKHGRDRSNVWPYSNANAFGRTSEEGPLFKLHPTVKPVRLVADALLDCSSRGDVVLDGFLGSGTTVIAAERTGRRCYGMEIDPLYVDTIVRRWQAYSGEAAVLAPTGKSFDEIAEAKEARHA
jgi:DNA modification methylase